MHEKIPEGLGMDNFISAVITSRKSEQKEIDHAISTADEEMRREGIVAVGDISNKEDSFKIKRNSSIDYHTFVEIFNMQNNEAKQCFNNGLNLLNKARKEYHLSASLVPHAPYSVSEELFNLFREHLNIESELLSIHSQETIFENDFIRDRKGNFLDLFTRLGMEKGDSKPRNMNSLKYLSHSIPEKSPLLLIHNVYTNAEDIKESKLNLNKTYFCLCPNSNQYISKVFPGTFLIDNFPDKVCLGTDSLSSNHRLSIIEEMKSIQSIDKEISLDKILNMATLNGAKALQLDKKIGSFEKAKKPGLVLIEKADLQNLKLKNESRVRVF